MKTGAEYRYQGKMRAKKFREAQEKKGFKSISVFVSSTFIEELKRIQNENGMTRNEAINQIFEVYQSVKSDDGAGREIWPNKQSEIPFKKPSKKKKQPQKNIFEDLPSLDDAEAYRARIEMILSKLEGDGLSHSEIATFLTEKKILTPKGKSKWFSAGVRGLLNHLKIKKKHINS